VQALLRGGTELCLGIVTSEIRRNAGLSMRPEWLEVIDVRNSENALQSKQIHVYCG
jgi:hypothetical protein